MGKRNGKKRVVVIGWDGATWDLIDPWIKEGKLPFLGSLKESGAFGLLQSTTPHLTPPAWTSIFTGVNPGKHGIFDFFELERYKKYPVFWAKKSLRRHRAPVHGEKETRRPQFQASNCQDFRR